MSEYSESYHLRTEHKEDGKNLLNALNTRGIVFEPVNGWVSVLVAGELNSQIHNVAAAYDGTVLHYMYAEDHAWMTNLFTGGDLSSGYVCAWDPDIHIEDESLNIEAFSKLLLDTAQQDNLEKIFSVSDYETILAIDPAYSFAELLGIKHYQWMAGQDLDTHGAEILEANAGAELVD